MDLVETAFLLFFTFLHPGHWGRGVPQPDGAVCGGALQPQQELLHAAGSVAEGGAAASRLPIISGHRCTESKLFKSDSQVGLCFFLVSSLFGTFFEVYIVTCLSSLPPSSSCRERVNKRRMKEIVKEFTLLCRGLHGTEYAAEY